ncbi:MAG: hypothetical protein QXT19_04855 [Candidatus Woesearchaeota archaeon]
MKNKKSIKTPEYNATIMKTAVFALMLVILATSTNAYTIIRTGMQGSEIAVEGNIVAFVTYEEKINKDLTGDNDTADYALQYYDVATDRIRNTGKEGRNPAVYGELIAFEDKSRRILIYNTDNKGLINTRARGKRPSIFGQRIGFATLEKDVGDLNKDGDDTDTIIQYYDMTEGEVINTETPGENALALRGVLVFDTAEDIAEEDLDRDGTRNSKIIQYYDFEKKDVVNTGRAGSNPAGYKEGPVVVTDSGKFWLIDLHSKKKKETGISGNHPSLYQDLIAYEKNGALWVYRISTGIEKPLGITGTEPVLYDNILAFIDENKEVAVLLGEDTDNDDIPDFADNCPDKNNPEQEDSDKDNMGNVCDETPQGDAQINATEPRANTSVPEVTAAVAVPEPVRTAPPQPETAPAPAKTEPRKNLPETPAFEEKQDKNPAYWFLIAVGITMIGIIIYIVVPRWMRKRRKSYGF